MDKVRKKMHRSPSPGEGKKRGTSPKRGKPNDATPNSTKPKGSHEKIQMKFKRGRSASPSPERDKKGETSSKDMHKKDASPKDGSSKEMPPKEASPKGGNSKEMQSKDQSSKDVKPKSSAPKDKPKDAKPTGASPKSADSKANKKKQAAKKDADDSPSSDEEEAKGGFGYDEFPPSPRRHVPIRSPIRTRRVYYHDENDLADTIEDNPNHPHRPMADDLYSPWDEAVKKMRYASVISGLSMAIALVAEVAVNGTDKLTVDRVWLPVQFLRTVMNDKGETPPNILKFLEHIDVNTKETGSPHYREVFTPI